MEGHGTGHLGPCSLLATKDLLGCLGLAPRLLLATPHPGRAHALCKAELPRLFPALSPLLGRSPGGYIDRGQNGQNVVQDSRPACGTRISWPILCCFLGPKACLHPRGLLRRGDPYASIWGCTGREVWAHLSSAPSSMVPPYLGRNSQIKSFADQGARGGEGRGRNWGMRLVRSGRGHVGRARIHCQYHVRHDAPEKTANRKSLFSERGPSFLGRQRDAASRFRSWLSKPGQQETKPQSSTPQAHQTQFPGLSFCCSPWAHTPWL